jgi:regulator of replication initiation timing
MRGRNRTFPKDGQKKLKETIKQLKEELSALKKENAYLKEENANILKPIRIRRPHKDMLTHDEWRQKFLDDLKKDVKKDK